LWTNVIPDAAVTSANVTGEDGVAAPIGMATAAAASGSAISPNRDLIE
jgi:hypothetical protein